MAVDNYEQLVPSSQNVNQGIPPNNVGRSTNQSTENVEDYDQDIIDAIKEYIDRFKHSEETPRNAILKICQKCEYYWEGWQNIFWDENEHTYRLPEDLKAIFPNEEIDTDAYDKVINIYKAHGESILAALSAEIPTVKFFPENADVFDDILTAKSWSEMAKIVQRKNQAPLLFIRALYILFNQGLLCAYNYIQDDQKASPNKQPIQGTENQIRRLLFCPECGAELGDQTLTPDLAARSNPPNTVCPSCGEDVGPEFEDVQMEVPAIVGEQEIPKKREKIELYGPTHVQIPHYVTSQDQIPILIFTTDQHRGLVAEIFTGGDVENLKDDRGNYKYDRWARLSNEYYGDLPEDVGSLEQVWIRPWVFNTFEDDVRDRARAKFPNGAYCVFFNDEYIFSDTEDMDDHWTISVSPTSSKIHAQPLGKSLLPIQDMTNEAKNLTLETIRYSIPETFVDTKVVSLAKYKKTQLRPGMLIPATPRAGRSLGEGFYTNKTASLSREVGPFEQGLHEDAQFTSGAFPSIYGGALEGGSGTLGEYNASRAQALQRLQIVWKTVRVFWAEMLEKSVRDYISNMEFDEHEVQESGRNSYINVWVRRRNLTGQIGRVEPEASEHFPVSWAQKRDILLGMIQFNNPAINEVMFHPENRGMLASYLGFDELYIPGDGDRDKQLAEIALLIQSPDPNMPHPGPMMIIDELGRQMMIPTVDIDSGIDDDPVHITICISWLLSPMGQQYKQMNPGAYMNVVAHKEMHEFHQNRMMLFEAKQQQELAPPQVEDPESSESGNQNKSKQKQLPASA